MLCLAEEEEETSNLGLHVTGGEVGLELGPAPRGKERDATDAHFRKQLATSSREINNSRHIVTIFSHTANAVAI